MADSRITTEGGVNISPVTPAEDMRTVLVNRVSWGAVFAGIMIALVTQLILTMLGAGIGLISLDPGAGGGDDPGAFSVAAGIWWVVSGILSALAGGYTAGRLSGKPKESTAAWHGLAAWAGSTLVIFYLLTTAVAGLVGGILGTVGGLAETAAQVAAPVIAEANPLEDLERRLELGTPNADPAAARAAAIGAVVTAVTADEPADGPEHQQAIAALAATGMTPQEAETQVADLEARYDNAVVTATEAADDTAAALGTASIFAVLGLLLGAGAGYLGGRMGKVNPTVTGIAYV